MFEKSKKKYINRKIRGRSGAGAEVKEASCWAEREEKRGTKKKKSRATHPLLI
jgi:hypothetical protein